MKTLTRLFLLPILAVIPILLPLTATAQERDPGFSDGEIRQLLAPIALYPDALLSQVLIAATYPLEVVEAARWSRDRPGLEGQAAVDAAADRDWDPSIKSLVAFPDLLARMSEELDWTRRLGDAFLLQEEDVIAAVQDLRERADAAGTLDRLDHARARRDGDVIVIDPVDPRVVYVPYYSPRIVYGGWWWSGYPPHYWYPPSGYYTGAGFYWGSGVVLSGGFFFSSFDWRYRHIVILRHHRHHFHYVDSPRWRHNPKHRRGVVYRAPAVTRHLGQTTSTGRSAVQRTYAQEGPRSSPTHRPSGVYYSSSGDRRPAAVRRATSNNDQRGTQEVGSTTGARTDMPASNVSRSGVRGPAINRSGSTRPARDSSETSPRRETTGSGRTGQRDSVRSTGRRDTATVQQQRPAFSGNRAGTTNSLSAGSQRPSAGGIGSRPSALNRGTR